MKNNLYSFTREELLVLFKTTRQKDIIQKYDVTPYTLRRLRIKFNISNEMCFARKPEVTDIERSKVMELHATGLSMVKIAREIGRSQDTVRTIITNKGGKRPTNSKASSPYGWRICKLEKDQGKIYRGRKYRDVDLGRIIYEFGTLKAIDGDKEARRLRETEGDITSFAARMVEEA